LGSNPTPCFIFSPFANVEIIIQEWIETAKELGRPIPAPAAASAFA
jgi:predicted RNase H-like HicB family nuclease